MRQRYLGVMLPYTPLHILLLEAAGRPLVMTSGNLAEEPIVRDLAEIERLAGIPDYHLVHDRDIAARYDDSVAIVRRGQTRLVRRSRGYAPFPLELPRELPQVLACGAELKNTFCLTRDRNAFLSQHIGDLENLETLEHFEASIALYERLFRLTPEIVAYDLHPEYLATKYALRRLGAPPDGARLEGVAVQHHHAHIAACLAENGHVGAAIGVSLDGLGYGADGALVGRRGAALRSRALPALRPPRVPAPARRGARHRASRAYGCWLAACAVRPAGGRAGAPGGLCRRRRGARGPGSPGRVGPERAASPRAPGGCSTPSPPSPACATP